MGLGFALLTTAFFLAVTRRREPPEMLMQRVRLAQHSDFGKQLYTMPAYRRHTVRLPLLGRVSVRVLGSVGVFCVAAAAWWLSPWPIRVKKVLLEDMTVPMAEEPRVAGAGGDRSVHGRRANADRAPPRPRVGPHDSRQCRALSVGLAGVGAAAVRRGAGAAR